MKKVLILGSDSMAGYLIYNYLINKDEYKIYGMNTDCFNISDTLFLKEFYEINPMIEIKKMIWWIK